MERNCPFFTNCQGVLEKPAVVAMLSMKGAKQKSKHKEDCQFSGSIFDFLTIQTERGELEILVIATLNIISELRVSVLIVSGTVAVKVWAKIPRLKRARHIIKINLFFFISLEIYFIKIIFF